MNGVRAPRVALNNNNSGVTPIPRTMLNKRLSHKYEEIKLEQDRAYDERLHCFNGLLPVNYLLLFVYGIIIMVSLICITLSSYNIHIRTLVGT